jgi:hypothetical protein
VDIVDDDTIRVLLKRLARPHPSGGEVIERSVILAEGEGFTEVIAWIVAHAGAPEGPAAGASRRGLHGSRLDDADLAGSRAPLRYVLPAGALA